VPGFAGLSIDTAPGGVPRLVVRAAGALRADLAAEIGARLPASLAGAAEVRAVDHDLGWLEHRQEEVARLLDGAATTAGIRTAGTSLDVRRNAVVVWAPGDGRAVSELLGRTVGLDGVVVEPHARMPRDAVSKDDAIAFYLVEGGQRLTMPGGDSSCLYSVIGGSCGSTGYCTSGFAAVSPYFGNFLLTAGHCGKLDAMVKQGGLEVGRIAAKKAGGNFDVALVSTTKRNIIGRIHLTSSNWFARVDGAVPMNGDPIGALVCQSGVRTTGVDGNANPRARCGVITSRTYQPPAKLCPDGGCNAVFRLTTYKHGAGDSGAGVYADTGGGRAAVGIHKGSGPDGAGVYSPLPYILREFGLRLAKP
jgi:hypothetical protein